MSNLFDSFRSVVELSVEHSRSVESVQAKKQMQYWEQLKYFNTIRFAPYYGNFFNIIESLSVENDTIIHHSGLNSHPDCSGNWMRISEIEEKQHEIKPGIVWIPGSSETMKGWIKKESKFYDLLSSKMINMIVMLG